MLKRSKQHWTTPALAGAFIAVAMMVACTGDVTAPLAGKVGDVAFAKPSDCNASTNLVITMGDATGDALLSDGGGSYAEGVDGVGAHFSDVNGNLLLMVQESATRRIGYSTSVGSGLSDDRLYTNSHTNPGGTNACGLDGMLVGSTGSAVVSFELAQGNRQDIVHYGKLCSGSADAATRVTTTHGDANSWTITGTSGRHCRANAKGNGYSQVGTAGAFSLTLVRQ
jgi:hypothetical protein